MLPRLTERGIFSIVAIPLLFLLITFDPVVSITFLALLFFGYMMFLGDRHVTYPFEKDSSKRYLHILIGAFSVPAFYFAVSLLLPLFERIIGIAEVQSVFSLYSSNMLFSQYILAGVTWIVFLVCAFLIPISENIFVIRIYEGLLDVFNGNRIKAFSIASIMAMIAIASIISLFHIQSKGAGIKATPALFITLLFFVMIIALTAVTKDMIAGVSAHIVANAWALKVAVPEIVIPTYLLVGIPIALLILALRSRIFNLILRRF